MITAAFRIRSTDIPLGAIATSSLAAIDLRSGGAATDLSRVIPADRLVSNLSDSDLAEAASAAHVLARIRQA